MTRAPRKYLDRDKVEVNPDWLTWREEQNADRREAWLDASGYPRDKYYPEEFGKDLGDGAWIIVIEVPFTALAWDVPLLSMWRARPHRPNSGRMPFGGPAPYQAVIQTPAGDLHLWPHEYVVASDPVGLMACDGATVHDLGGDPALDENVLWYVQSRGIDRRTAILMLADQIKGFDYAYVTFPPDVTAILEGVGRPLWRHVQLNPRDRSA